MNIAAVLENQDAFNEEFDLTVYANTTAIISISMGWIMVSITGDVTVQMVGQTAKLIYKRHSSPSSPVWR